MSALKLPGDPVDEKSPSIPDTKGSEKHAEGVLVPTHEQNNSTRHRVHALVSEIARRELLTQVF